MVSEKEKRKSIILIIISSVLLVGLTVVNFSFLPINKHIGLEIAYAVIFIILSIANSYMINSPSYTEDKINKYSFEKPSDLSKVKYEQTEDFINYQYIIDEYKDLLENNISSSHGEGYIIIGFFLIIFTLHSLYCKTFSLIEIFVLSLICISLQILIYNIYKFTDAYIPSKKENDFTGGFKKFNIKICQNYGTNSSDKTASGEKDFFFRKLNDINGYMIKIQRHRKYRQPYCNVICVIMMVVSFLLSLVCVF